MWCESLLADHIDGGRRWKGSIFALAASGMRSGRGGAFVCESMVRHLTARPHAFACARADKVRAYRWLSNESVTACAIDESFGERLKPQVTGRHILVIQDTTELNFEAHADRLRDLGTVGNGTDHGLFLHPQLAVDADSDRCFGLVGAQVWNRTEGAVIDRNRRPIEDKESKRWLVGGRTAKERLSGAAHVTLVADRESDIYEEWVELPGRGFDVLTRAAQDRRIVEGGCLFAFTDQLPVRACYKLSVPRRPDQPTRQAIMEVRFGTVRLRRPKRLRVGQAPASVPVQVVDVREVGAAADPIHWRLLTTHPVPDAAAALQIVQWYRRRWHIELLFWTLKRQGLNIESSQLETAHALMNLAMVAVHAATLVMQLVRARDGLEPQPAADLFDDTEVEALVALQPELEGRTDKQRNPHPPRSLAWAAWTIARLGGWDGYARRPAGPITMKRGLAQFQAFARGFLAARSVQR